MGHTYQQQQKVSELNKNKHAHTHTHSVNLQYISNYSTFKWSLFCQAVSVHLLLLTIKITKKHTTKAMHVRPSLKVSSFNLNLFLFSCYFLLLRIIQFLKTNIQNKIVSLLVCCVSQQERRSRNFVQSNQQQHQ